MAVGELWSAFGLGLLASASPCVLALFPGYLAFLGGLRGEVSRGQRFLLGAAILAGVLTMLTALGALLAALTLPLGRALRVVVPLADGILILLGLLLLSNHNPFERLPMLRLPAFRHPLLGAYVYGLLYGPLTLPCSGVLVVSIFALSLTAGEALGRLGYFIAFGLGMGAPLLALSLLAGGAQRAVTLAVARHPALLNRLSGALLLGIAVADLVSNAGMFLG